MEASTVTINETEARCIADEREVEELCQVLRIRPSFWLYARRVDGVELDMGADVSGATAFYLDMKRGVKLVSLNTTRSDTDIVRMKIDALPEMELETERCHVVPLEEALSILRQFLCQEELDGMVPWPID
jgi:hypothetical protein